MPPCEEYKGTYKYTVCHLFLDQVITNISTRSNKVIYVWWFIELCVYYECIPSEKHGFAMEISVELKILTDFSGLRINISWHIVYSCDTNAYMVWNTH